MAQRRNNLPSIPEHELLNFSPEHYEHEWFLFRFTQEPPPTPMWPIRLTIPLMQARLIVIPTQTPMERYLGTYQRILSTNLARQNTRIPAAENIYQPPLWIQGKWHCLVGQPEYNHHRYIRDLSIQFDHDKDFFRCLVTSMFGPMIASIHFITVNGSPSIEVRFRGRVIDEVIGVCEEGIKIFATLVGRLRFDRGEIPSITKVFGFWFCDEYRNFVSSFETRERAWRDDTFGADNCLIVQSRDLLVEESIDVGDDDEEEEDEGSKDEDDRNEIDEDGYDGDEDDEGEGDGDEDDYDGDVDE